MVLLTMSAWVLWIGVFVGDSKEAGSLLIIQLETLWINSCTCV